MKATATLSLDGAEIAAMDSRRRAAFVNSLSGYKSANLVGSVDEAGRTNLAIMSSAVHLGSDPPLLALVIRPGGEERHTLANILATGCYSINHVHTGLVEAAHQTAARYERHVSEFDATGLELRDHQELAINRTHLLIGEIVLVRLPADSRLPDGAVDLAAAGTVALSGLDHYHAPASLKRMAYAKPLLPPRTLAEQADAPE